MLPTFHQPTSSQCVPHKSKQIKARYFAKRTKCKQTLLDEKEIYIEKTLTKKKILNLDFTCVNFFMSKIPKIINFHRFNQIQHENSTFPKPESRLKQSFMCFIRSPTLCDWIRQLGLWYFGFFYLFCCVTIFPFPIYSSGNKSATKLQHFATEATLKGKQ